MSENTTDLTSSEVPLAHVARAVLPPNLADYCDLLAGGPAAAGETFRPVQQALRDLVAGRATGDDPGDVALVLALTLAARYPAALADPALADVAGDLAAAWWAALLALATAPFEYWREEVIAARMHHLLTLGAVFDALPADVLQPVLATLWAALAAGEASTQIVAVRALQALPAHLDADRVRALVAQQDTEACKHGLALAGVLGDRVPVDAMLPAMRDDPNALLVWADRIPITDLLLALFHGDYALHLLLPTLVARRTEIPGNWLKWLREKQASPDRLYAMRILFALGEPVDAALVRAALAPKHTEQDRAEGMRLLGLIGDPVSVAFLERLLADEQDWSSAVAAEALGLLGDRAPLAPLIAALDAPTVTHPPQRSQQVRAAAARALLALGPRVPLAVWLAHLDERTTDVHLITAQALAAYDAAPIAALVPLLWRWQRHPMRGMRGGNSQDADRDFAAALRALAPRITAVLLLDAATDEPEMRACAASVLGAMADAASRATLVAATKDADAGVRLAALEALGDHLALADLRRLADDEDTRVRAAAVTHMATRHDHAAALPVADLVAQVLAPQRDVWLAALRALGSAAPVDLLLGRLTDTRGQIDLDVLDLLVAVDAAAARDAVLALRQRTGDSYLTALGHLGDLAPRAILIAALDDIRNYEYNTAPEAACALLRLGELSDAADPVLLTDVGCVLAAAIEEANQEVNGDSDYDGYVELMRAVVQLPPLAGMALLTAFARGNRLDDPAQRRLPTEQEIPRIITKTLSSSQEWVRACAALVLRNWRGRVALDPIVAALADLDDEVRATAAWLLGYCGDVSVSAPLRELVADPVVGYTAACALLRLGATDVTVPKKTAMDPLDGFTHLLEVFEDDAGLAPIAPVAPETLIVELGVTDPFARAAALRALGQQPANLPVTRLTWALGDSWADVRQAALAVLRDRAPAALAALAPDARATLGGTPTGVFTSLGSCHLADLLALAQLNAPDCLALLEELLAWPYFEVRLQAARAATTLPGPLPATLLRRLAALCHDTESVAVRAAADDALAARLCETHREAQRS